MDKGILLNYPKGDYLVSFIYEDSKTILMKIFKNDKLIVAPESYKPHFWTSIKIKAQFISKFIEMQIWNDREARKEIEWLFMELYDKWEELQIISKAPEPKKEMTKLEIDRALSILKNKNLMILIKNDLDRVVAGEDHNKLLLFLIFATAYLRDKVHPRLASETSAGKTHVINNVLNLFPEEDIIFRATRTTGKALEYHLEGKDLNGKIMLIQEFEGAQDSVISLRPLMSGDQVEGGLSLKTVGKDESGNVTKRELNCTGVPVIGTCSTQLNLDGELETRTWKMEMDESQNQTGDILKHIAEDQINHEMHKSLLMEDIQNALRYLNEKGSKDVRILYANKLIEYIPTKNLRIRRDLKKIFAFIKASAYLHQFQRPKLINEEEGTEIILATAEDFDIANVLSRPSMELTLFNKSKKVMTIFEKMKDISDKKENKRFNVPELIKIFGLPRKSLRSYMRELVDLGLVMSERDPGDKRGYIYNVPNYEATQPALSEFENDEKDENARNGLNSAFSQKFGYFNIKMPSITPSELELEIGKIQPIEGGVFGTYIYIRSPNSNEKNIDIEVLKDVYMSKHPGSLRLYISGEENDSTEAVEAFKKSSTQKIDQDLYLSRKFEKDPSEKDILEYIEKNKNTDITTIYSLWSNNHNKKIDDLIHHLRYNQKIFCPFVEGEFVIVK